MALCIYFYKMISILMDTIFGSILKSKPFNPAPTNLSLSTWPSQLNFSMNLPFLLIAQGNINIKEILDFVVANLGLSTVKVIRSFGVFIFSINSN